MTRKLTIVNLNGLSETVMCWPTRLNN